MMHFAVQYNAAKAVASKVLRPRLVVAKMAFPGAHITSAATASMLGLGPPTLASSVHQLQSVGALFLFFFT